MNNDEVISIKKRDVLHVLSAYVSPDMYMTPEMMLSRLQYKVEAGPRVVKCDNCAAPVNPSFNRCEYCGSYK